MVRDGRETENGEGADDAESIGGRLRRLREQHRYSMRRLGEIANVSASLISDIERGRVEPSISVLKRLAAACGTTLMHFFTEPGQSAGRLIRASQRRSLGPQPPSASGTGIRFELASPDEAQTIQAIMGEYAVGASLGDEPVTHEGEEWGMVLQGRLKVSVADEVYFLDPGDSIWFPSMMPHRVENIADDVTRYVWINTPKSF